MAYKIPTSAQRTNARQEKIWRNYLAVSKRRDEIAREFYSLDYDNLSDEQKYDVDSGLEDEGLGNKSREGLSYGKPEMINGKVKWKKGIGDTIINTPVKSKTPKKDNKVAWWVAEKTKKAKPVKQDNEVSLWIAK